MVGPWLIPFTGAVAVNTLEPLSLSPLRSNSDLHLISPYTVAI